MTVLIGFHHAGGSPSLFRSWGRTSNARVAAHTMAGRAGRRDEVPSTDPAVAVHDAARFVTEVIRGDSAREPYVLFGHSLGGQLAPLVAAELVAAGLPAPARIVVSAARAPCPDGGRTRRDRALPLDAAVEPSRSSDEDLVTLLRRLGGVPGALLGDAGWRAVALPVLRADLMLSAALGNCATTSVRGRLRTVDGSAGGFGAPVRAFGGRDDPLIAAVDLVGWSAAPPVLFPGGHFYLLRHEAAVVRAALDGIVGGAR
jgi:surfactin synthase thioesterase subunit